MGEALGKIAAMAGAAEQEGCVTNQKPPSAEESKAAAKAEKEAAKEVTAASNGRVTVV